MTAIVPRASTLPYSPPTHILEILQQIEFEEALAVDDPRYVETTEARGSQRTMDRLARKFGLLLVDGRFFPPGQKHVLFFGHTGSGKSTELRRYAQRLAESRHFFVVEIDITLELDRNNLQYADVLMAMAHRLVMRLSEAGVNPGEAEVRALEEWFAERVLKEECAKDLSAQLQTGGKATTGIPFLGEIFAKFTSAVRTNVSYKDELRRVVRNSFTQFAEAFNRFLRSAEANLGDAGEHRRVLFIVDGSDKIRGEDSRAFFVHDAEQLLAIEAHIVYTAPLSLKYEGNLTNRLDDLVLPMIKLTDQSGQPFEPGRRAMREILLHRAARQLFASDAEIDRLVEASGGHPRELLRLLKLACEYAEENEIDARAVDTAIEALAADYRRFLDSGDYETLARIDGGSQHSGNDDRIRKLLYNLALLEYNDGSWRRSHPVIRSLDGYRVALVDLQKAGTVT